MLENISMGLSVSDEEYKDAARKAEMALYRAQQRAVAAGVPVLITVSGMPCAGRGDVVNLLSNWMSPKHTRTHVFWTETDVEKMHAEQWRYWRHLPAAGETCIYYDSWYGTAFREKLGGAIDDKEFEEKLDRCINWEEVLTDAGVAVVKIWLNLDKKEYKHRQKVGSKTGTLWAYTNYDKFLAEHCDAYVDAAEKAIHLTDTVNAPWAIIDASNDNYRNLAVADAVTDAIEQALDLAELRNARHSAEPKKVKSVKKKVSGGRLAKVDLSCKVQKDAYDAEIRELQLKIRNLSFEAYQKGISSSIVLEGWEASGRGGVIRRLLGGLDVRIAKVVPGVLPDPEAQGRHYLWRYWKETPRRGCVTVYEGSWYGRVLDDRVEHRVCDEEWERAYDEINAFESDVARGGNVLLKFWLQISAEEQLKRFNERESATFKRNEVSEQAWERREKRAEYEVAIEEMFARTSTKALPWIIVPTEDKRYGRLVVLRAYVEALQSAIRAKAAVK